MINWGYTIFFYNILMHWTSGKRNELIVFLMALLTGRGSSRLISDLFHIIISYYNYNTWRKNGCIIWCHLLVLSLSGKSPQVPFLLLMQIWCIFCCLLIHRFWSHGSKVMGALKTLNYHESLVFLFFPLFSCTFNFSVKVCLRPPSSIYCSNLM